MQYKIKTKAELEEYISHHWNEMNLWIDEAMKGQALPLTCSVDIRESKTKYAPVDNNLYPAGFNNICSKDLEQCAEHFREAFDRFDKNIKRVGLLPESHTKNKYYLDNIYHLKSTIEAAGTEVTLFSVDQMLFEETKANTLELESFSGHRLSIHRGRVQDDVFVPVDPNMKFDFDLVILNNDQSVPFEINWKSIKSPVMPPPSAGWYQRQKIAHFEHYRKVVSEFCQKFEINPDLMQAHFSSVNNIDFSTKEGIDILGDEVDKLLKSLPEGSSVFVKASQGTYGMGISVVSSGEEIRSMNRKMRNKMDVGKSHLKFTSVLIQEGVETIIKYDDAPSEVTIYLIDGKSSGGFVRMNPLRGTQANLNAQGMIYRKFCISEIKQDCDYLIKEAVYSIVARLSALAAAREIKDLGEKL